MTSPAATATGIPTIAEVTPLPAGTGGPSAPIARKALSIGPIYRAVDGLLVRILKGPSDSSCESSQSDVWAQLSDADGKTVRSR